MTNIDLFGNEIEESKVTSTMRRIVTRQAGIEGRDLYTTEPEDIERFLIAAKKENLEILNPIWEPAAGMGDISKTLIQYGHKVYSTDLYAYKDEEIEILQQDFLSCNRQNEIEYKTIFTNPPFNAQEEFLLHALSFGIDVIFFVRLSFLSSIRRYKIYEKYKPSFIYIYSSRARCYKDGNVYSSQSMIDYCIMIWKSPYETETITRWIE